MKNLKRFVVVFMTAALFSTSFTSCIDNDVDPAVMSIYRSQADLIAAQVALLEAEAALAEAQAAHELALADLVAAQAAQAEAIAEGIANDNAFEELVRLQELMVIEAETAAEVARIQNEMLLAQQEFENEMAQLLADLAAAGAAQAAEYAAKYTYAMNEISALQLTRTEKVDWIAEQELYLALEVVNQQQVAAMLAGILADLDAQIADKQAQIAAFQAIIDDPTSTTAEVQSMRDAQAALEAENAEIDVQIAELNNDIQALYDQFYENEDLVIDYMEKLAFHDYLVDERDALIAANEMLQDDIDMYTQALADYDGVKAGLEADLAAAEAAQATAQADADAAQAAEDAAITASDDADAALADAQTALADLQAEIDMLEASLNAAAALLAAEQAAFDAGIGAATVANDNAINDIATAQANVAAAWANYTLWRDRFEGAPVVNGGFHWEDPGTDPFAPVLGTQDPTSGVAADFYVRIDNWFNNGPDDNTPDSYEATVIAAADLPVGAVVYAGPLTDAEEAAAYPNGGFTTEYYYEVGLDDVSYDNLAEFQAATTALGNEDIMDVMPVLGDSFMGDGVLGGDDAYTDLWDAYLAQLQTQDFLDNFGNDLADAQTEYDYWKNLYENELALLDAAQADEAAAQTAADDAQDAEDAAIDASDAADIVLGDAIVATADAQTALDDFCATTKEDIQDMIDGWMAQMAENDLYIAEFQIGIDKAFEEVSELQDAYDALMETPLNAQLLVDIYELYDERWALEDQQDANYDSWMAMENIIYAMEMLVGYMSVADLEGYIADCEDAIMYLEQDKATAIEDYGVTEQDQMEYDAMVAMIQRWIDLTNEAIESIDAEIATWETLAAEYKALMEAALSS